MIQKSASKQNSKPTIATLNSGSLIQPNMNLSNKPDDILRPIKDLTKIFPDIDDQLCSRHSTLFGKLKYTFNKLYDSMQPSYYVIVKGNTHIIGNQQQHFRQQKSMEIQREESRNQVSKDQVQLSMALENGIIILVTKTYQKSKIFINGNHIDEQLIFGQNGQLDQGLYQYSDEMQTICKKAVSNIVKFQQNQMGNDNLFGGIMYIHANIPENFYNYKNSLLTGIYLSMMLINGSLESCSISQLITQISQTGLVEQQYLQKQFYDYQNRQLSLMVGQKMYKVPLDNDYKLIFCRLDLAHCDIVHSKTNIKFMEQQKTKIIQILNFIYGIKSFFQLFQNYDNLGLNINQNNGNGELKKILEQCRHKINLNNQSNNPLQMPSQQQIQKYIKLIQGQLKELHALCEYSNNKLNFESLIKIKWLVDSKLRCIYSQQVVQLVEDIKLKLKISACTMIQKEYLMMFVERQKFTQVICKLRHLLHKGQLRSKSCFKLEQQLVQTRWGSDDNGISQKIFVSVPSKGIAVFDPKEAIWFD